MADNTDMNRAFPEMTIEMGPSPTRTLATSQSPLRQIVDNAFREILSWRPKLADPKGFITALDQAFTGTEVDGHIEFSWTPHSYEVQADMGAVTGAQASIYARAKAALDQSVPLLEGLYPLRADADDQDTVAIRALVRDQFTELVSELGQVGGPRLQRVDAYFDALLGRGFIETQQIDSEKTSGLIGDLREEFGFERVRINTIDEERNLTNFLILVDHVIALQQNWKTYQHFFDRKGHDVFLGTQLVLISRALAVIAESVQEFYFVMDSVFLGAAERQTIPLIFAESKQPQMTIGELLGWIERFASVEGPRIIRDSGKQGVVALLPTVRRLRGLVNGARSISEQNTSNPTAGFHTERVRKGWLELDVHVTQLATLLGQMRQPAPIVTSVYPSQGFVNELAQVTVNGENFQSDAEVELVDVVTIKGERVTVKGERVTVVGSNHLHAWFNLAKATSSVYNVVVTNVRDDSSSSANDFTKFASKPAQTSHLPIKVIGVRPNIAHPGDTLNVEIFGIDFSTGASSIFGDCIKVNYTDFITQNQLCASISVMPTALPGGRAVIVNVGGQSSLLPNGFTVAALDLTITDLSPTEGAPDDNHEIDVVIRGTGFKRDATSDFGAGIQVKRTDFKTSQELLAKVIIAKTADAGRRVITVTNHPDQQSATSSKDFTVLSSKTEPLTVKEVAVLDGKGGTIAVLNEQNPTIRVRGKQIPAIRVNADAPIHTIRVTFSDSVSLDSVVVATAENELATASFAVGASTAALDRRFVPGSPHIDSAAPNVVHFAIDNKILENGLPTGTYNVSLCGGPSPTSRKVITDAKGQALDGNANGKAGGNFDFTIVVAADAQAQ